MSTAAVEIQDAIFEEAFATIRKKGVRSRYDNFIGGKWVAPILGKYFARPQPDQWREARRVRAFLGS